MKKNKNFRLTLLALSVATASCSTWAQQAPTTEANDDLTEIIEVKGLRGSIIRSTMLKQTANSLIDVISAEDVGKFPDANVIDSMQRITGIQIDRDATGEANGFQVRGISQNRVEMNGRSLTGGQGEGRNANLGDIPSALIDSLEVIKSPTADLIEGSLGATVNLKTKRPLQMKNGVVALNAKVKHADNYGKTFGNLNAIYADKWLGTQYGDIGFLFNLTYNDNKKSGDILRVNGWGEKCDGYVKGADGLIDRASASQCDTTYYAPENFVQLQSETKSLNESIASTIQWRPNDYSEYLFEFAYIHKEDDEARDTLQVANRITNDDLSIAQFDAGADENGVYYGFSNVEYTGKEINIYNQFGEVQNTVLPVSSFDSSVGMINSTNAQGSKLETETFTLAFEGKWYFDNIDIKAEVSHSQSEHERHYIAHGLNRYAGNATNDNNQILRVDTGEAYRQDGGNVFVNLADPRLVELAYSDDNLNPLNDLSLWRLNSVQDDGWIHKPQESAARVDVEYYLDLGDITTIEFGVRGTENIFDRSSRFRAICNRNNSWGADGPNAGSYEDSVDPSCQNPSVSAVDFYAANPEAFKNVTDFYSDHGVSSIDSWTQLSQSFYFNNPDGWYDAYGIQDVGYVEASTELYTITEDTAAVYLKANMSGDLGDIAEYRGNFGVRGVYTHVEAMTTVGSQESGYLANRNSHHYMEWLPSFNLAITHDAGIIRLAAAKVMVRPNFSELKPTSSFNNFTSCGVYDPSDPFNDFSNPVPNPNLTAAEQERQLAQQYLTTNGLYNSSSPCPGIRGHQNNVGNPQLNPYISYNYDVSLEKYWGEGNSASIAFFYRDVRADIELQRDIFSLPVNETDQYVGLENSGFLEGQNISSVVGEELWRVRTYVNGDKSIRQGVELAYTQFFDFLPDAFSGLGMAVNYTLSDGSRPKPTFIDNNANAINFEALGYDVGSYTEQLAAAYQMVENGDINSVQLKDPYALLPIHKLSRHSGNISLFYDKDKINSRLALNYRSKYLLGQNAVNPIYEDDSLRLDFSSNYQISDTLGLNFSIQNLTKEVGHRYTRDVSRTERSYYTDRIFTLGANMQF